LGDGGASAVWVHGGDALVCGEGAPGNVEEGDGQGRDEGRVDGRVDGHHRDPGGGGHEDEHVERMMRERVLRKRMVNCGCVCL
jgi:hypothetical protein